MSAVDILGWVASGAVLLAMAMPTMERLRLVAIGSNLAFIAYAGLAGLTPILLLHLVMLAVNVWRLTQIRALARAVARLDLPRDALAWLPPGLPARRLPANALLFEAGEAADAMYVVVAGRVVVEPQGIALGPGEIVGEIGLFAPGHRRTATVRAAEAATVLRITRDRVAKLHYDDPDFAWGLIGLVTRRLVENDAHGRQRA